MEDEIFRKIKNISKIKETEFFFQWNSVLCEIQFIKEVIRNDNFITNSVFKEQINFYAN